MGTSGNKRVSYSEYISALLISFTKIKAFCEFFKYQDDKEKILSNIFNSLINNNFSDELILELNKLLSQNFQNIKNVSIDEVINFILSKLHEENNELKNNISFSINNLSQNMNNDDKSQVYKNFLDYHRTNKSIIQDLFYREDEIISVCSKCKSKFNNFNLEKIIHFNMLKYYNNDKFKNLNLFDLIKEREEEEQKNSFCEKCNINTNMLNTINFKKLPEIFIISFGDINFNKSFDYYLNMNYGNEKYILIGIIINKDEKNEDSINYNSFYREYNSNNKWFIYDITKKETKEINEIKTISQNPLVCYYQKKITYNKILINKFYNQLNILYNDLINLEVKTNKHIENEKVLERYYIINKNLFNKLTKIFEKEEIFNNTNILFESFNSINNIYYLDNEQINNINELIIERLKLLSDDSENIFIPELEINEETGIKYPKDLVLIPEKYLNNFLTEFGIEIKIKEKLLYNILCGEKYIFIKDNNESNNNVYFICSNLLFSLRVEKILKFKDEYYFQREINLYVKNKGLENYYEVRKLKKDLKIQNIIDKEYENIGDFISIINE